MPLEGDRPIRVYHPDPSGAQRWLGFAAWARRQDRTGRVDGVDDQRVGEWTTAFVIRAPVATSLRPRPDWRIIDEFGEQYVIENVTEVSGSNGGRLRLMAFRSADAEDLGQ